MYMRICVWRWAAGRRRLGGRQRRRLGGGPVGSGGGGRAPARRRCRPCGGCGGTRPCNCLLTLLHVNLPGYRSCRSLQRVACIQMETLAHQEAAEWNQEPQSLNQLLSESGQPTPESEASASIQSMKPKAPNRTRGKHRIRRSKKPESELTDPNHNEPNRTQPN